MQRIDSLLPKMRFLVFIIIFFILLHSSTTSLDNNTNNNINKSYCNIDSLPNPVTLRSDKLTVLISGYSPSRIPLLSSLALSYSSHPSVSSVLILWFNPSPSSSSPLLSLASASPSISLHLHSSSSLAARFLPRPQILTRSVLVCDDDIQIPAPSLSFAFRISSSPPHRDSIVGFFARSHDLDLGLRSWIYTVHPDRYSIVLTKLMILKTEYLYRFSCGSGKGMAEARAVVERERNCEDILMNFVAATETGAGPVLVEGRGGVRDWGDPRNNNNNNNNISENIGAVEGALSGRGDHRRKRGECIREFHRVMGEMPLSYSYGKVVEGVGGDQGLCRKGGKLVYCDRDR